MANNDMDRVVPLGQLDDYKVAEGDPDVRGWEVLASDGRKIGEVDELLVDTNAMKVRYLDVDVEDGVIGDGMDRHVLIPIGYARLEQERDCVMVDGLASSDLQALPAYDQGPLTRDFESSVRDSFSRRGTTSTTTAGMTGAGAGMLDTAGMDNTPGMGTGLGMTGTSTGAGLSDAGTGMRADTAAMGDNLPAGEGMRAAGYDLDRGTTGSMHTGSDVRDTGSLRTGLDSDLGTPSGGMSAGSTGGLSTGSMGGGMSAGSPSGVGSSGGRTDLGGSMGGGMSAGSTSGPGVGGGGGRTEMGGTTRGDAMSAGSDETLVGGMSAGTGSQGMGTDRPPQGDMSHRAGSGMAGSDYLHNADEDFYASEAFDDDRFYGSRRGGSSVGMSGSSSDPGGMGEGMGADRDETRRLAREASERLREDERNRGVGGSGNL